MQQKLSLHMQINYTQQRSTQNHGNKKLKFQHQDYQNHGYINLLATDFFFLNFSTPCIQNVSNTETKQDSIMK